MTKQQIGLQVFAQIKAHIVEQGGSMAKDKFPPDFPICRASCYNIRNGRFSADLLKKLPFKVTVEYKINFT